MFAMVEEAGIFIVLCHHRLVLLMCDMAKSRELYIISISDKSCTNWEPSVKYALVIVDCLIDIIGSRIGCAYDIGCAFMTTPENSSLSEKVKGNIPHDGQCIPQPCSQPSLPTGVASSLYQRDRS
jgi:Kyakuja-Dileera-Zisupton transposase